MTYRATLVYIFFGTRQLQRSIPARKRQKSKKDFISYYYSFSQRGSNSEFKNPQQPIKKCQQKKSEAISMASLSLLTKRSLFVSKKVRHPCRWPRRGKPDPCRHRSLGSRCRPGEQADFSGTAGPGRSRLRTDGSQVPARGRP